MIKISIGQRANYRRGVMNIISCKLILLALVSVLLPSCNVATERSTEDLAQTDDNALSRLADDSFAPNNIGARFIPVLDSAEDVKVGARFDTLTGQIVGASPCIAGFIEGDNGSQNNNMRLLEITDNYSLMKALDIDASVQGSYMGATASAKASFANSQKFTQQSQKFLLYAKAERKPKTIDPDQGTLFGLTDDARAKLNDRQAFRKLCGDSFVVAIFEGIEMFGMLNFQGISQSGQKKVSAAMGGSYGGWSASTSATKTVDTAMDSSQAELTVSISGRCDALGDLGGDMKSRWASMVNAGSKLPGCAETGGNITTYKVIPYSSTFIRDWPYDDDNDPKLNQLLFYYGAYGAVLDSINTLLMDRDNAYRVALLDRGIKLSGLDELASTIRGKRADLRNLLTNCQSSASASNRAADCQSDGQLQATLEKFVHPYVYRAQLPLYFVDGKPVEAFLSNSQIAAAVLQDNVQSPRDVACTFADKAGLSNYPGCPDDFNNILSQAKSAIKVAAYQWPRDKPYVFQTQSTSNNLCMVAPTNKKIVTASTCGNSRQRMIWQSSGQLKYSHAGAPSGQCVQGRNSAVCDTVKTSQLWRFVPGQSNAQLGLLQNADGLCLAHSNTDRNVTYRACSGELNEKFYQWKPIQVK